MKHILWSAATAALLFASCAKDDAEVVNLPASDDFTATLAAESRTVLNGTSVLWETTDEITIFTKTAHNRQYKVKTLADDQRSATFGYVNFTGTDASTIEANYALYPYDAYAVLSGDVITTKLASEQYYYPTQVALENSLMVAKSSTTDLAFKNAGALVRFKLAKENLPDEYALQSIKLTSTKKIAGEVTINLASESKAVVTENGVNEIVYNANGVVITTTPTEFYVVLPAMEFAEGDLKVTFVYANGEKSFDLPAFTLAQNSIKTISYTIKADDFNGTTGDFGEAWDGETVTQPTKNEEGYYEISKASELAWFGGNYHDNMVLTADIDMGGHSMQNIITYNKELLGNGHKISNLKLTPKGSEGWTGFFANSGNTCGVTVKDVVFENIEVVGKEYSAVVVAYAQNNVVLENVKVLNSSVKATNKVGALVGFAEGSGVVTITNCSVEGTTISTNVTDGEGQVGAVVGYVAGSVTITNTKAVNNTVESNFSADSKAFGKFVGMYASEKTMNLTNCSEENTKLVGLDDTATAYAADYDNQCLHNLVGARRSGYAGTIIIDGARLAATAEELNSAIAAGETEIKLAAGSYELPSFSGKEVTISGGADVVIAVNQPNLSGSNVTFEGVTVQGSGYSTGVQHVNTITYNKVTVKGEMCLYGEKVVFNECKFELASSQYLWTYGAAVAEFNNCTFNTAGKAIVIYNEGYCASDVTVSGCTFNATAGATAGAIAGQNCAAIELDNFGGMAHKLTTRGNTYDNTKFSGEWRIKNYVAGGVVTVNGTEYTQIALDGRLMNKAADNTVTFVE